ncbi:MAG: hypothetical protein GF330_00270 [Candidatus Eisenbacteria bacterium]|nr:hypothetical protein [Candidatus Eisenbacteria bacterium]
MAALLGFWIACVAAPGPAAAEAPTFGYDVVAVHPHDTEAFTQGLILADDFFYESTGGYGESTLRKVEVETGLVVKQYALPEQYFAEGLTALRDTLHQLTWTNGLLFRYVEEDSFALIDASDYPWDGWGLTHDGTHLIASDGSWWLRLLDPGTLEMIREFRVEDDGNYVHLLNELEFIEGWIYANIWHDERIVVVDPASGGVEAWLDLGGLCDSVAYDPNAGVLNGIAYDPVARHLFVTGKQWPLLFEIDVPTLHPQSSDRLVPENGDPRALLRIAPIVARGAVEIDYHLPADASEVRLCIVDPAGRLVQHCVEGRRRMGWHGARVDLGGLPAGVHFVRLDAGAQRATARLLLLP